MTHFTNTDNPVDFPKHDPKERIRALFEDVTVPSFGADVNRNKDIRGRYANVALEEHWDTFQEAFEVAVCECADLVDMLGNPVLALRLKQHFGVTQ